MHFCKNLNKEWKSIMISWKITLIKQSELLENKIKIMMKDLHYIKNTMMKKL